MDKTNGEDLAFPLRYTEGTVTTTCEGLSKREYFAAKAMQGMVLYVVPFYDFEFCAKASVVAADALIAELNREKK